MAPSNVAATLALIAWTVALGTTLLDPQARLPGGASLLDVRSAGGALALLQALAVSLSLHAARFVPLGTLAVLALPDREGPLSRLARVAVPAALLALVLAGLALAARAGFTPPGPFELLLPGAGILLGVWGALTWRRGWWARLVFLPKLAALAALLLTGGALFGVVALEGEPAVPERAPLKSEEKRRLVDAFRGKDPRRVPQGETRTVRLTGPELDQLVSWAATVGLRTPTRVRVENGVASGVASVRVPRSGRWLNVSASARLGIADGQPSVSEPRLAVGRFSVPPPLLGALARIGVEGLRWDRDLRRILPAVRSLEVGSDEVTLTYARVEMPRGLLARLLWGEEASTAMRESVYLYVDRLLEVLAATPEGDARFTRALETAFALARERSAPGSAVEENRSALLALGVVLGHPRLARAVGEKLDEDRSSRVHEVREGASVRGRNDWVRHFTVSGALAALSSVAPSDAMGLLKEELDADGGSGFSFADLLADRAGTTLAGVSTRDEARARAIQDRLAAGVRLDDVLPPADGLPEGVPDAQLRARYGGVGGRGYRRLAADIERRVAACAAYRD